MAIKLHSYDAADFLDTEEDIQNYLNEALADGNPAIFAKALGNVARARGMTKVSAASGVTREALYRSFSGKGNPEFGTVVRVARAVGFHLLAVPSRETTARGKKAERVEEAVTTKYVKPEAGKPMASAKHRSITRTASGRFVDKPVKRSVPTPKRERKM